MWESGNIIVDAEVFEYHIKYYDKPSKFGIDKGRVSKLELSLIGNAGQKFIVALYDRKWIFKPKLEIAKKAIIEILYKYK